MICFEDEKSSYYLNPAALIVSDKPLIVNTILGSCVGVVLYDPILRFGGINHFMLPLWNGVGLATPKYGNIAIEKLYEKMLQLGCNKHSLVAKVFGGGEVIESNIDAFRIGKRNIMLAQEMLNNFKIKIVSSSVGGRLGRKIQFHTDTGDVLQKYIDRPIVEMTKENINLMD